MSSDHAPCLSVGSTDRPMILVLRRSNSGFSLAMYPSSVVHTGVKSRGCEKSTAHESPIQSWNLIRPSVVSASKSGAVSPSCNAMWSSWERVVRVRRPHATRGYTHNGDHRPARLPAPGGSASADAPLDPAGRRAVGPGSPFDGPRRRERMSRRTTEGERRSERPDGADADAPRIGRK